MKYPDYLMSAKRHNKACRVLQDRIEMYREQGVEDENIKFLVLNMYYLSGYIVECSLKYKIYELFGYSINAEVDDQAECAKVGINYKRQIKLHCFSRLQNLLDSKLSDISHLSEIDTVGQLLKDWNPEKRYENFEIAYQDVQNFYAHTTAFLRICAQ